MQKRTPAAHTLALQISDDEKLELLVTRMLGAPPSMHNMRFISTFISKFNEYATPAQRVSFIKLYDMGWKLGKVVWHPTAKKIAFSVRADGEAAWVTPDGKLTRAAIGKRTTYLDSNWKDVE